MARGQVLHIDLDPQVQNLHVLACDMAVGRQRALHHIEPSFLSI